MIVFSLCFRVGDKKKEIKKGYMLNLVDTWNRHDIAEKEIFNLENRSVFKMLQVHTYVISV